MLETPGLFARPYGCLLPSGLALTVATRCRGSLGTAGFTNPAKAYVIRVDPSPLAVHARHWLREYTPSVAYQCRLGTLSVPNLRVL